ncbi:probable protein phosphatase 2C 55 [Solanum dulcamara]|uniref:probable protein phosphatase 2C 55 n=1 Tax=Solanum dulcamara TaxID=45834 RepID=UPI00248527BB|nr:probable protein phosphatase 2C 55 [Solanum dulcamara]
MWDFNIRNVLFHWFKPWKQRYKNTIFEGSFTACIITLDKKKNTLYAANGKCKDNPSIAQEMKLIIDKDDILIVGTDGMLVNMNESEIEKIVRKGIDRKLKAEELVGKIGKAVWYNSFDRFADTPYARTAKREGLSQTHKGGNIDDITVIIAYIN